MPISDGLWILVLVQDFTEAIKDYTKVIELDPDFAMAYFNRAVVRYKQLDYNMSQAASSQDDFSATSMNLKMGKNPTVVRTRQHLIQLPYP